MMLSTYSTEKIFEFERKEIERTAREYWKWTSRRSPEYEPVKKEVNDK
jgi:hypothetical protein